MLDCIRRKRQFPVSRAGTTLQCESVGEFPTGKVACQPNCSSIRSPFSEYPTVRSFVQTVIFMSRRPIAKLLPPGKTLCEPLCVGSPTLYGIAERLEPGIVKMSSYLFHAADYTKPPKPQQPTKSSHYYPISGIVVDYFNLMSRIYTWREPSCTEVKAICFPSGRYLA